MEYLGWVVLGGGALTILFVFREELKTGGVEAWTKALAKWEELKAWFESLSDKEK
jgi:hypothetical protein